MLLSTIREETETVLRLDPSNVEGLILAGSLAAQLPGFLGGTRTEPERLFRRALEVDPRRTGARLELAPLYITTKRWSEARDELQGVPDDPAPTDLPRWTFFEIHRARELLEALQ